MSNQAVGNVYQTIIEEVINSSRVDFEDSGVEEAVLEQLRQGWQQKLSQLDVARFPWDPKPETAPPAPPAAAAATSTPNLTQTQFSTNLSLPAATNSAGGSPQNGTKLETGVPLVKQEPGVPLKQEPGSQQPIPYPNYNGPDNKNNIAANRAAQQLHAQYGNRAAGSINAIQQQQPQMQPQQPGQQSALANAQTDGTAEAMDEDSDDETSYEGILERRLAGKVEELGRVDIDRLLHDQIAAKARSMEGGGLMLSLKEAAKQQKVSKVAKSAKAKGKGPSIGAYDGNGDDDENDEDAINSDLDDPDDGGDDDEVDDEGLGHIMLCMYDKVQRVKNKWKCTLKDGVLTVNGKEYVFNKATGEYEW